MITIAFAPTLLDSWLETSPQLPGLVLAGFCCLLILLVALPRILSWRRSRGRPVLDPIQLDELLTGPGALVVDLRDQEQFRSGHIQGSLHTPYLELGTHFLHPDPVAKRALVLVDETDKLSHQAFAVLASRGFTWMYVLRGGLRAWRKANRPLSK